MQNLILYLESSFEEKTPDQDFNRLLQDNEAPFTQHDTAEQGTGNARKLNFFDAIVYITVLLRHKL